MPTTKSSHALAAPARLSPYHAQPDRTLPLQPEVVKRSSACVADDHRRFRRLLRLHVRAGTAQQVA